MQPDIDAQLSNSYEETPQPDFAKVLRGYDSRQVQKYLKQIDRALNQERAQVQAQVQALRRELADVQRQIQEQERPTDAGPESRVDRQLRLAEEQQNEILEEAKSAANEINAKAKVEAAQVRAAA